MTLIKLPPLPKRKTSADERKERLALNLKRLPAIRSDWGSLDVGRWAEENVGTVSRVMGRCARCGEVTHAHELRLHVRPFGRGEQWWCSGCTSIPKEDK